MCYTLFLRKYSERRCIVFSLPKISIISATPGPSYNYANCLLFIFIL